MTHKQALRSLLLAWDWPIALLVVTIGNFTIPADIAFSFAKDIFAVSISVLSIVFSVFFAALAVLITSGDNEFVWFLQEDGSYSRIIWTFRVTLTLLASSLVASILLYVASLHPASLVPVPTYPRWLLLGFCFLGLYSLLAAVQSSFDTITYAQYRADYLRHSGPRNEG